mgnify:CR=1 FL=1
MIVVLTGLLLISWQRIKRASDEVKAKHADSLGTLVHYLPYTRRDLHYFYGVLITAGIVEEIVYRGFVLWYLVMFMPLWVAMAVSSIAFGLGHSYQGAGGAIRVALLGLFFAIFYVLTGSIFLPIIAHIVLDVLQGAAILEILRKQHKVET